MNGLNHLGAREGVGLRSHGFEGQLYWPEEYNVPSTVAHSDASLTSSKAVSLHAFSFSGCWKPGLDGACGSQPATGRLAAQRASP